MAESAIEVVPFYDQLSCVLSSAPIAEFLTAGLHRKCVLADGTAIVDEELQNYLTFLSEIPSPVVLNVPIFFADTFKPLVLELFGLFFSVNDVFFSAFIGDLLCRILQGSSAAAKISKGSVAEMFLLDNDVRGDQNNFDLLKQFGLWRHQAFSSSSFQILPVIQADYESVHPYTQEDCKHSVRFPANIKHISVSFDSRSQTYPDDTLTFSSNLRTDQSALSFSGTQFTKHQELEKVSCMVFPGNEFTASFDCMDESFEEQRSIWGYKFTAFGFAASSSVRQSIDSVRGHLNSLFKELLMSVCARDARISFPLEVLDNDVIVAEAGFIFSEMLTDDLVRNAFEQIFFAQCSESNVSRRLTNLFQSTVNFAAMKSQSVSPSPACGKCNAGHVCEVVSSIPETASYRSGGWSCDVCKKSMSRNQANVWHCPTCSFDVCPSCQPVLLERLNSEFHVGDLVHLVPPEIADYRSFSDAGEGPMQPGSNYPVMDVRPEHVNISGQYQF